jgi:cytochrome b561
MLTDTPKRFGLVSVVLHWLAAAVIIYMFVHGSGLDDAPDRSYRAWHVAIGSALAVPLIARVHWRLTSQSPEPLSASRWLNGIAATVRLALLFDIVLVLATGFLAVWMKGDPIVTIGGLVLPSPIPGAPSARHTVRELHSLFAHLFVPLVALHVLGALKHLVWDRDGTFGRMLWLGPRPARKTGSGTL